MRFFNFEQAARDAGIPANRLKDLEAAMRSEFPRDEMMCELHVLRACLAIKDGMILLEDALRAEPAADGISGSTG